jgi:PAS domain S-box-containing protein
VGQRFLQAAGGERASRPARRGLPAGVSTVLPTVVGVVLVAALTVVEIAGAAERVTIPLLVLGPLAAATGLWVRGALAVGALAIADALLLNAFAPDTGMTERTVDSATVLLASVLSVAIVHLRVRDRDARRRADFLGRSGDLLEGPPDPDAMLAHVTGLAVPDMADVCIVDLLTDRGELRGAVTDAADPALAQVLRDLRARYPLDRTGQHPVARALREGHALLLPAMNADELHRYVAGDGGEARGGPFGDALEDLLRRLHCTSAVVVPLLGRDGTLGVISFLRLDGSPRYVAADLTLLTDLTRRAAMGLDNARLFAELDRTEAQLEAILDNLVDGVTVQDPTGRVIYANEAAGRLMGVASAHEILALPPGELMTRYEAHGEGRRPIEPDRLPAARALRGELPAPLLVRQRLRATGDEAWVLMKSTPVYDEAGRVALAVNVIEDVTEDHRAAMSSRFLSMATKMLASSLDIELTLDKVAWAAVPEMADWCAVDMPDRRGVPHQVALAHIDPEVRETLAELRQRVAADPESRMGAPAVLRTGGSVFHPDVDDRLLRDVAHDAEQLRGLRDVGMTSILTVPMIAGERTIGTITFGTTDGRRLEERDVEIAEELGRRAGVAVENARLHTARSHIAATLQRSLLPPQLPSIPSLTIAARFRAAGEANQVGGDFYDVFPARDNGWMAIMGDVTGKGPSAAAITSLARDTVRIAALYERWPEDVLARLNEVLAHDEWRRQLCTAVCMRVDLGERGARLRVTCAGHPPPLLLRPGGTVEPLGAPGTLLGAFEEVTWPVTEVTLAPGEAIVLYTDGVTDTRGEHDRFGTDRLVELLRGLTDEAPDDIAGGIEDALLAFEAGTQRDDVALLVVRADPALAGETGSRLAASGRSARSADAED